MVGGGACARGVASHRESAQLRVAEVAQGDGVGLHAQIHAALREQSARRWLGHTQPGQNRRRVDARQSAETNANTVRQNITFNIIEKGKSQKLFDLNDYIHVKMLLSFYKDVIM